MIPGEHVDFIERAAIAAQSEMWRQTKGIKHSDERMDAMFKACLWLLRSFIAAVYRHRMESGDALVGYVIADMRELKEENHAKRH
jgi:hypothetical protein